MIRNDDKCTLESTKDQNHGPNLTYPRTGKRGVPQQFPRRLYEMIEAETNPCCSLVAGHQLQEANAIIEWSQSGRAFRINDISLFAAHLLPKYFRTSKFSSFQRNLNLYGFTKVRRGPDADMYAHPAFIRGYPQNLSQLRKNASSTYTGRKTTSNSSISPSLSKNSLIQKPISLIVNKASQAKVRSHSSSTHDPSVNQSIPKLHSCYIENVRPYVYSDQCKNQAKSSMLKSNLNQLFCSPSFPCRSELEKSDCYPSKLALLTIALTAFDNCD